MPRTEIESRISSINLFHDAGIADDHGPAERKEFAAVDHLGDDLRPDPGRIAHGYDYEGFSFHRSFSFGKRLSEFIR